MTERLLDPRWEWEDIYVGDQYVKSVKIQCNHLTPVPVESGGEVVSHLCPDCDAQLPPDMVTPAKVWHLATCIDCTPILPQPFRDEAQRNKWADTHETIGHTVVRQEATEA